jgi:hypothetical protein
MISYALSLGDYGVYIQFSIVHCGPLGPLSTGSSVNSYKSTKIKILSIICIRSFFSGRPSRACSIQQAWLMHVRFSTKLELKAPDSQVSSLVCYSAYLHTTNHDEILG